MQSLIQSQAVPVELHFLYNASPLKTKGFFKGKFLGSSQSPADKNKTRYTSKLSYSSRRPAKVT